MRPRCDGHPEDAWIPSRHPDARTARLNRRLREREGADVSGSAPTGDPQDPPRSPRPYVLSGLISCAACGRRMQGQWNHEAAYYRCRYRTSTRIGERDRTSAHGLRARGGDRTQARYMARPAIRPFESSTRRAKALARSSEVDDASSGQLHAATRTLADCDRRLIAVPRCDRRRSRPGCVAEWMKEVQGQRLRTAQEIREHPFARPALRRSGKGPRASAPRHHRRPRHRGTQVEGRGICGTGLKGYLRPREYLVMAGSPSCATERVGGPSAPLSDWRLVPWRSREIDRRVTGNRGQR